MVHGIRKAVGLPTQPAKVGFISLGCPKNLADSEVALGLTAQAGFALTRDPAEADLLVINTCGFLESARQESVDTILEMAQYKEVGRCRGLVVTGCLGQRYGVELLEALPEVDVVLGSADYQRLPEVLDRLAAGDQGRVASIGLPDHLYTADLPRVSLTAPHTAYLKIGEGCDNACTFCSIPLMRGGFVSRPIADLLCEAESLAARGVQEVVLISQDTTAYGCDRPEAGEDLAALLRALDRQGAVPWIRLLYAYPGRVTDDLIEALATCDRVVPYLDMPLQHIGDEVLRRMNRRGKSQAIRAVITTLRRRVPEIALRTTFIVGFPGETDADFRRLCDFVAEVGFDWLGGFTYSEEEGTAAVGFADPVAGEVAEERLDRLMALQRQISRQRLRSRVGRRERVLVDGLAKETDLLLEGRTAWMAPEIDGVVYLNDGIDAAAPPIGRFVEVEITETHDHDLVGRVVG
jgi:ribosomal protein S12 methylthiotransferase